jgi:hypothetical protein
VLLLLVVLFVQFGIGFYSYLWPKASLEQRAALGPYHRFLGLAVWTSSLAAMAVSGGELAAGRCIEEGVPGEGALGRGVGGGVGGWDGGGIGKGGEARGG